MCVCVCVHKGSMLHIISRLCVSTGRAITMVTPSTEHLLKGSLAPSVFYLLWGHSASFTHSSRLGDRENGPTGGFPDIWSVMLFISRQFGTSEKSKPCHLCHGGTSPPTRTSVWFSGEQRHCFFFCWRMDCWCCFLLTEALRPQNDFLFSCCWALIVKQN